MRIVSLPQAIFLLIACQGCEAAPAQQANLAGHYVSHGGRDSYVGLLDDGRGVGITKNPDGTWQMAMSFYWSVYHGEFCQKDIVWTSNGTEFFKQHDTCTKLRIDGENFYTQHYERSNDWAKWERTDHDVIREFSDWQRSVQSNRSGGRGGP